MNTAERQLAEARKAWLDKHNAEMQLARLRRYARMTAGMKDDQRRYSEVLHNSINTLDRVLGGAQ